MLFIVTSNIIKYLGINLTNMYKPLLKNYTILLKEIEEDFFSTVYYSFITQHQT